MTTREELFRLIFQAERDVKVARQRLEILKTHKRRLEQRLNNREFRKNWEIVSEKAAKRTNGY